ncbi:MAG: hypothetical protein DMG90_20345 [Acidobacteria bacterium]|nr:MAG: hypothetical protein DMG90_20345 [Acidobacteriota bacterium]
MKIRGLLTAVVVLLVLGGTLYWSDHHKSAEGAAKPADTPPQILKLDEASASKIELRKKDAGVIAIAKSGSGVWQITAPKNLPADQSAVSGVLSTLSSLNAERVVEDKASDFKRYGLDQPVLVADLTDKSNAHHELKIGDDTPTSGGTYAMLSGDPRVFTIASYVKSSLDKSLNDLRDKRLQSMTTELNPRNREIEFGRNKDDWQIVRPKPLRADGVQVADLVRKLTDAKMDSSVPEKDSAAGFTHGTPIATAKLTNQSGSQELQVRKNKDTYFAKSSAIEGTFKVDADLGQELNKKLDDFRNKKVFDFGFSDPDKIELHSGDKAYYLTRTVQDWWSNGKKMDPDSVQSLISKLRDLSADKFLESGFFSPTI